MKRFRVIVADPPWPFKDSLKMSDVARGAQANYSTMTMQEIRELPVNAYCHPDGAVLCLWVPGSLLQDGLDTMKAWGFKHKQTYIWVKTKKEPLKDLVDFIKPLSKNSITLSNIKSYITQVSNLVKTANISAALSFGMGRLFRQTHEICLIGTSGSEVYKQLANKSQRSVCFAENLKHSAKPEELQNSLEIMFPKARKLELFARRVRPGWTCLGNEVCNGDDIRVSLSQL
jgi:mRNA (2'-O-methyladenosine-N6-)-methyltransferase